MYRRYFLKITALISASVLASAPGFFGASAQQASELGVTDGPIQIVMGGAGLSTTSFSRGLKYIGDRLEAKFGDQIDVSYVYDVNDPSYDGGTNVSELVDSGALTLSYRTMYAEIPALELAALPFLFEDLDTVRAAMDGPLGQAAIETIEAQSNWHILGFFENGFRHVSNSIRPVHTPADLRGLSIRCLSINTRIFELLGTEPIRMNLRVALQYLEDGTIDGQENPFENTVSYNPYLYQRYHTATFHSYLSRPIFINRDIFDSWPEALQSEMRAAAAEAMILQRELHDKAEIESQVIIREAGGEIVELTPEQRAAFVAVAAPMHAEAKDRYSRELLDMVDL